MPGITQVGQKQTVIARLARLIQGQCPIHGIAMIPVHADSGLPEALFCCSRADCAVTAHLFVSDGTFELSPEFDYLLAKEQ
jgi:hypothetical protein